MTAFTDEVRETVSPYKFGGSRMAAACYLIDLDGGADDTTGDTEWSEGYIARIGRRIMEINSAGSVYVSNYISEAEAVRVFDATDARYCMDREEEEAERELLTDGFVPSESVTIETFLPGDAVTVDGWDGIAFRVDGLPVRHGPNYEWSGIVYQHPGRRLVHMVGDDHSLDVDVDDLKPLADEDYCGSCGQIGCPWC